MFSYNSKVALSDGFIYIYSAFTDSAFGLLGKSCRSATYLRRDSLKVYKPHHTYKA